MIMKKHYLLIVRLKRIDVCIQLLCFAFIVAAWFYNEEGAWGVSLLATVGFQLFSALFWLFTLRHEPCKLCGSTLVRITLVSVPLLLLFVYECRETLLLLICYAIAFTGPVLVCLYFILTFTEIHYYKKLARKG